MSLSKTDLEAQNETNLLGLMSNSQVGDDIRLYAAVLLYKRGSRFLAFEEYQPFKGRVLDYLLQEHSDAALKPFAPNVAADSSGRLHKRLVDLSQATAGGLNTAQENIAIVARALDKHKDNIWNEVSRLSQQLFDSNNAHDEKDQQLDKKIQIVDNNVTDLGVYVTSVKRTLLWAGAGMVVLSLAGSYLITHFLR